MLINLPDSPRQSKSKKAPKSRRPKTCVSESSDSDTDDVGAIKQRFGVKTHSRSSHTGENSSNSAAKRLAKDDGTEKAYRKRIL